MRVQPTVSPALPPVPLLHCATSIRHASSQVLYSQGAHRGYVGCMSNSFVFQQHSSGGNVLILHFMPIRYCNVS